MNRATKSEKSEKSEYRSAIRTGLAVVIGLASGVAIATQVLFQDKLTSKITVSNQAGQEMIATETARFVTYGYAFPTPYLFAVTERVQTSTATDGYYVQEVEIKARQSVNGTFDREIWTAKVQGSEFQTWTDDFVRVIEFGCCGAQDIARLININSGKRIEAATLSTLFAIEIPNRAEFGRRYIATVIDSKAPQKSGTKTYVGTVSYFDGSRILSRARIYSELAAGHMSEIYELKPVHLTNANKLSVQGKDTIQVWSGDQAASVAEAFSGFAVEAQVGVGTLQAEDTIRIVINGDQIDLGRSTTGSNTEAIAN